MRFTRRVADTQMRTYQYDNVDRYTLGTAIIDFYNLLSTATDKVIVTILKQI